MAWSAPMTAIAGATFTAAQFNQYIRDNLNECPTAKATSDAQFFVSTGANAVAARELSGDTVLASQATTSTTYTNLATVGPQVSVNTSDRAVVFFASQLTNSLSNGASSFSVAVSGATSVAASDDWRVVQDGVAAGNANRVGVTHQFSGLNAGSNTFTMQYKVGSGTGTYERREIVVLPF